MYICVCLIYKVHNGGIKLYLKFYWLYENEGEGDDEVYTKLTILVVLNIIIHWKWKFYKRWTVLESVLYLYLYQHIQLVEWLI